MTPSSPLTIGVIAGSTRPNRRALSVAHCVRESAARRSDMDVVMLDILDFDLPLLDEPQPPAMGAAVREHTHRWAEAIGACDGFVFVAPEYNHSLPGALKNALDYLFREWRDKAAGTVGYGVDGGVRSVEHLRQVLTELSVANVRTAVALNLARDFDGDLPAPTAGLDARLHQMLDELARWATALRTLRRATA